ncbi:MAG: 2-phospho-L-lactate guanylyltransferase [Actinobacteria bacterium]|nr:2-phospho-L-lactate guanylyltransferase [Actinomycetota bacterium]
MASIVVPFRSPDAKRRLAPLGGDVRAELALAMLGDVLAAAVAVAPTTLVTSASAVAARSLATSLGAAVLTEPRGGQGAAVTAALAAVPEEPLLVLNADVPSVQPRDLLALLGAIPPGGVALVAALDGTTNALALASPRLFEPLYGPGSAARFLHHAEQAGLQAGVSRIPSLQDDVDTVEDLERLGSSAGPRTLAALGALRVATAS